MKHTYRYIIIIVSWTKNDNTIYFKNHKKKKKMFKTLLFVETIRWAAAWFTLSLLTYSAPKECDKNDSYVDFTTYKKKKKRKKKSTLVSVHGILGQLFFKFRLRICGYKARLVKGFHGIVNIFER